MFFQFSWRHFSFIIINFYCSMLIVSYEMELRTSGRCPSTLTDAECKKGPYPKSSYKWFQSTDYNPFTDSTKPTGCYVMSENSYVWFNRAVDGTECTSERSCFCKKGKFSFIFYFWKKNFTSFYIIRNIISKTRWD